ncbi:cation diffusion facilitator family transporter [Chloroflexota bacterium]
MTGDKNTSKLGVKRRIPATKEGVAKVSIFTISFLIIIKIVASILTGSVGIRADAVHSIIDLSGAVIGFIGIRIAGKSPDEEHAFGHGKAENITGVAIAMMIFVAAGAIVYEAVKRLIRGATVEMVAVGIYVTVAAIVINIAISWYALRVSKSTDSVALEATARHMLADVYSSCAVLAGLILVKITGLSIIDPIVALLVAILIVRTAYLAMKKSFGGLIDTKLPADEESAIRSCITKYNTLVVDYHKLRTRKSGSQRYIDLHVIFPRNIIVEEAHKVCDQLEKDIEAALQRTDVTIHVEPCNNDCDRCPVSCTFQSSRGKS